MARWKARTTAIGRICGDHGFCHDVLKAELDDVLRRIPQALRDAGVVEALPTS